jgi:hypothetical protein
MNNVDNLISEPNSFAISAVKNSNVTTHYRKTSLGQLTNYIGLIHELAIVNHSKINVETVLKMGKKAEIVELYGQILKAFPNQKL